MTDASKLSPVEGIKTRSRGLRGGIAEGLQHQLTGSMAADDQQLIKFHGIYQQDDRDRREERERKKLEPAYSYMIRLRLPGGDITAKQYLGLQPLLEENTTGILKITTRQTIQVHGVIKSCLKPTMAWFAKYHLDAIAACGDVNRNVMAGAHPAVSPFQEEVHALADKISSHLLPKTSAYAEIWLDGEKLSGDEPEPDPLYQNRYLPRKFKIAIAIPPHNETDVFAHDVGLVAIEENGRLAGFNLSVGGGMGATHGNAATYPRLGTIIGFVTPEQVLDAVWQVAAVQRDFGNREDRKLSRLKYTVDRMGIGGFRTELEQRLSFALAPERPYTFDQRADYLGWRKDHKGLWHYTVFVENGLVADKENYQIKTALIEIAKTGAAAFRFTANQNIMLLNVTEADKPKVQALLETYGIEQTQNGYTPLRTHAIACVALSTCPLALAEGQRYLPDLIGKIEPLLDKYGMKQQDISIRMTGCPNGCARPYMAEIGLVGRSMGHYNLHIGGGALGQRLNALYKESLGEAAILETLDGLFASYKAEAAQGETFGDFTHRKYITA